MVFKRIFGMGSPGSPKLGASPGRLPLAEIRQQLHEAVYDCKDIRAQRMIYKINMATTPSELWLLRSDLHECIAQAHSQGLAAERINNLLPAFKGWLPDGQLTRI